MNQDSTMADADHGPSDDGAAEDERPIGAADGQQAAARHVGEAPDRAVREGAEARERAQFQRVEEQHMTVGLAGRVQRQRRA